MLRSFAVLDTEPEALFDELVALAMELLDVPIALVSLVDEHRQWFKARSGFAPQQTPREESICAHAILNNDILVVEDAREDQRFADNPLVNSGEPSQQIRFYAGAPLLTKEKLPLGTLCVIDHKPRSFGPQERRRLGLLRDQVMALLERRQLQQKAEHQTRRKSEFVAWVSHEVRTPLAAILSNAELLETTLEHTDDLDIVRTMLRNGNHLKSVVNDLLDLSKIEAGQLTIERVPCELSELLSDIDALVSVRAREKGIDWRIDRPEELSFEVHSDALRLRQILVNLVGNAVKFTERGEVVLSVAQQVEPSDITVLEFAVRDTGIGMLAEQIERVFEPFEQASSDTVRRFGGSGLGLTISQELARLLGGQLLVESCPGGGSVFRLRLPCEPVVSERQRAPVLTSTGSTSVRDLSEASSEGVSMACDRSVLIVDDSHDLATALARLLSRNGYRVEMADTAEEAITLASDDPPDYILLDHGLPDMPVAELLGRLRALAALSSTRIISLTGSTLSPDEQQRLGCDLYLQKPVNKTVLLDALAKL